MSKGMLWCVQGFNDSDDLHELTVVTEDNLIEILGKMPQLQPYCAHPSQNALPIMPFLEVP